MDPFRSYYLSSIIPQLKRIENERKILDKKITTITLITVFILTIIIVFILIITHRFFFQIYFAIPLPYTFLLKDLIRNYSKEYKEGVIKNMFLLYFDDYTIDAERKSDCMQVSNSGLLHLNKTYQIKTEDFITLKYKGNIICIQELLISQNKNVFFKGVLCSTDLKKPINQNIIFISNDIPYDSKLINGNGFKNFSFENVTIFYQDSYNLEIIRPYIEFTSKNHFPVSIQNGKLYCLFPSDKIVTDDKLELFEPLLTSKYNSNDTYRFIRDEYYRISKISRLLMKFEETNMA